MQRIGVFVTWGLLEIVLSCVAHAESMEDVVCLKSGSLSVRSDDLQSVIAEVPTGTTVKVFQDWGETGKTGSIQGRSFDFVRVQISTDQGEIEGWVARQYVRPESSCRPSEPKRRVAAPTNKKSFDSPNCCVFPIPHHPKQSYLNGQRHFGAHRKGRKHAACDIKYGHGTPVRSVTDGVVTRSYYRFYKNYNAIEVTHSNGFVARYGEVNSFRAPGVREGAALKKGQTLGHMGIMLHFELYSGKARGSLTNREKPYSRRSDLIDPTKYLQKWESAL